MDPNDLNNSIIHGKSAINWVIEICQKEGLAAPAFVTRDMKTSLSAQPNFEVECTVKGYRGQILVSKERSRSKKDAKQRSAISMLNGMSMSKGLLLQMAKPVEKTKISSLASTLEDVLNGRCGRRSSLEPTPSSSANGSSKHSSCCEACPCKKLEVSDANSLAENSVNISSEGTTKAEAPVVEVEPESPVTAAIASSGNRVSNGISEVMTNRRGIIIPVQSVHPAPATPVAPTDVKVETTPILLGGNHKANLNTFCIKTGIPLPVYEVTSKTGPSHAPVFSMKCTVVTSSKNTHVVGATRKNSQKVISQILALEMLEKLRSDLPGLQNEKEEMEDELTAEQDRVVESFADYLKRVVNGPESGCAFSTCVETFHHLHHGFQKRLGGETIGIVKDMMASGINVGILDSINVLKNLCVAQVINGLNILLDYRVYPRGESKFTCVLEFGPSANQMYACFGMGENSEAARKSAATAVLEYLGELALNS